MGQQDRNLNKEPVARGMDADGVGNSPVALWRPGERVHRAPGERSLVQGGPWRDSTILKMNDPDQKRKDPRPEWGKGELITSAMARQALKTQANARPTREEEEFGQSELAHKLAGVQADLRNTYVARQFKKHLESEGSRLPEYLALVEEKPGKVK